MTSDISPYGSGSRRQSWRTPGPARSLQCASRRSIANGRAAAAARGATPARPSCRGGGPSDNAAGAHYPAHRPGAPRRRQPRARARGMPWRFGAPAARGRVRGRSGSRGFGPRPPDSPGGGGAPGSRRSCAIRCWSGQWGRRILSLRAGGAPWLVAGPGYVIVALAGRPAVTTWPLRAGIRTVGRRSAWTAPRGRRDESGRAGAAISLWLRQARWSADRRPRRSSRCTDGIVRVLSGPTIDAPARPGVYFLRRGGARVAALVVNPEPSRI